MKNNLFLNIFIATVSITFMSACSHKTAVPVQEELKTVYSPAIGAINRVENGQSMFSKTYAPYNIIDVYGEVKVKVNRFINKDYVKSYTFKDKHLRTTIENYNAVCKGSFCCADTTNDGYLDSWWNTRKKFIFMSGSDYAPLEEKVPYKVTYTLNNGSFHYETLFQGRVGDRLHISFREFRDDMFRPTLTQNMQYEISENGNTIIGFKGLRIEVLKATNLNISYRVLHDYN